MALYADAYWYPGSNPGAASSARSGLLHPKNHAYAELPRLCPQVSTAEA